MQNAMQEYINSVYRSPYGKMKQKLVDNGYQKYIIEEHCLYDDELWIHPDTIQATIDGTHNPKYIFIYKDVYLNEWSSTQSQRRYSKLPKKYYKVVGLDK